MHRTSSASSLVRAVPVEGYAQLMATLLPTGPPLKALQPQNASQHLADDDDSSVDINENTLPAFLQNSQQSSHSIDDFKVKDPNLSINDWISREDAKIITATVADPHLVPNKSFRRRSSTSNFQALFTKNKAVYVVTIEGYTPSKANDVRFVERTFQDFMLLREVLLRRFPGCCPPALPSQQKYGAKREQVVRKRGRLLTLFLQTVADHPFFRNDQVFELFVANPMSFNDSLAHFSGSRSEGTERWRQALRSAPVIQDASHLIEVLRSELRETEKKLNGLKAAAKLEVEKAIIRATASQDMVKALDAWLAAERVATSPLAGTVHVDVADGLGAHFTTEASLPEALAPLALRYANYSTALVHEYGEHQMDINVLDLTRFELGIVTTWLSILEEALITERKVSRLTEQMRVLIDTKSAKALENCKKDLEIAKLEQSKFHRGLLCVELVRLKLSRVARALRLKFSITNMHVEGAEAILAVWRGPHVANAEANNKEQPPEAVRVEQDTKTAGETVTAKKVEAVEPDANAEVLTEGKIRDLAFSVAARAVEETRAKAAEEEAMRKRREQEEMAKLRSAEAHKDCRSATEVADMFWNLVYCLIAVHAFFILVFVSRGYVKEAIPTVVLAGLTFVAGFLVEIVYR